MFDAQKPLGWTERNMQKGWMRRVRTPADKKADKLKQENKELQERLEQLEQIVSELATKKGKK